MVDNNKYMNELNGYVDMGGPDYKDYDPKKQNITKVRHLGKRYIQEWDQENGTTWGDQIATKGGDTLYKVLKKHAPMSIILMVAGKVSPEEIYNLTDRGINEHIKTYEYPMDQGEKFVEEWLAVVDVLRELKAGKELEEESKPVTGALKMPEARTVKTIDLLLEDDGLPSIKDIIKTANVTAETAEKMEQMQKDYEKEKKKLLKESDDIRNKLKDALDKASLAAPIELNVEATQEIPEGKMVWKKSSELFPDVKMKKDFDVPCFEWEGEHPDVPAIDEHYIFRPEHLERMLYSICYNRKAFLQGDTGTGKTTLVMQVAARLSFPFFRINFDSDITRGDLVGKDKIGVEDKHTVSFYQEGILPKLLSQPCFACFDEIDFVMPDVGYVLQSTLEGDGMTLLEDGGRRVKQHPMCRLFATANTVGQGDETGKYQGARPQSLAFLDRFNTWIRVDYIDKKQRETLLRRHFPALSNDQVDVIMKYVNEHIAAFKQDKVLQPLSPRGILSIGEITQVFDDPRVAIEMTVLDRASHTDRSVLNGIVDRLFD